MTAAQKFLPYEEPGIRTALIQAGFLLLLNIVNSILDKLVYCGLIGQIFIGVAWGAPAANWLSLHTQEAIQQLGYLGLILLVYEGGYSTSFSQLKSHLLMSALIALTGVTVPIGISFVLLNLVPSTSPLQAFAAGAALCSTSIGTTFTILSTTGLVKTRLGAVLSGAAMMDDVAGLVMIQVISNLGSSSKSSSKSPSVSAGTIVRPITVAVGFALGLLLLCRFAIGPVLRHYFKLKKHSPSISKTMEFAFVSQMCVLGGLVVGATYAGTSALFAAYLAGACVSWVGELLARLGQDSTASSEVGGKKKTRITEAQLRAGPDSELTASRNRCNSTLNTSTSEPTSPVAPLNGERVFGHYCREPLNRILRPLFFASIGFSIPITQMFRADIIWRGIVFTVLMALGKAVTGIWLVRISLPGVLPWQKIKSHLIRWSCTAKQTPDPRIESHRSAPQRGARTEASSRDPSSSRVLEQPNSSATAPPSASNQSRDGRALSLSSSDSQFQPRPRSLYPAAIVGLAMVARGEIGFLIASVAETKGVMGRTVSEHGTANNSTGSSDLYVVVVWAITLCTIIGPLWVGTLVKRVQKLESQREQSAGGDPLGVWGLP